MNLLIGQSIGRYHILEKLGEGGMAVVYKAYDTRLDTDVALKIIRTEKITSEAAPTVRKRFENEARKTARLTHPNIVPVIDYGEYEGTPFLVMKYLPGGTLKEYTGKPMSYKEAINIVIPILEALDYAHRNGIIHRDVKPGNILITESGEPMLSDFGIAKVLEASEETLDRLTVTGIGIGTPEYMSPEQAKGQSVDARTDIYAVGIVLYELITGRRPFIADTPLAVVIKQTTDALPSPRSFVPEIPESVVRVLYKALAKSPEDRFKNAREFIYWLKKIDSPKVMELTIPLPKETQLIAPKTNKKWWLLGLIPIILITVGALLQMRKGFSGIAIKANQTQMLPLVEEPTMTLMPTKTVTPIPTAEITMAPTADNSYLFTNPYLGPALDGGYRSIGKGTITDSDITPDSRFLIVATNLGLYVYEVETLELTRYLPVEEELNQVEVNPDGTGFVTTDYKGNLTVWDLPTFEKRESILITNQGVKDIEFNHDGSRLILACLDQAVRIMDTASSEIKETVFMESRVPVSVGAHPSRGIFAVSFEDDTFRIFDIENGEELVSVGRPQVIEETYYSDSYTNEDYARLDFSRVHFSLDGSHLFFSDSDSRIAYNTSNYEEVFTYKKTWGFTESKDLIKSAAIKDGSLVITNFETGNQKVFIPSYRFFGYIINLSDLELLFSPDSTRLFRVGNNYIIVYDLEDDFKTYSLPGYDFYDYIDYRQNTNQLIVHSYANPSGQYLPTIWDEHLEPVIGFEDPVDENNYHSSPSPWDFFKQSPDGKFFVGTLNNSDFLYLWESETGKLIKRLASISKSNRSLSFSWDNEEIAVGMEDGSVKILSIALGGFTHTINTRQGWASVFYTPDGKTLLTIGTDMTIRLWDTENYALKKTIQRNSIINCLDFVNNGRIMITGDENGKIITWDTSTWEIIDQRVASSENSIVDIRFSHNQDKFALISGDTIQFWDYPGMEKIDEIVVSTPLVHISFSGDDRYILSSNIYSIMLESHHWAGPKALRSSAIIWQVNE